MSQDLWLQNYDATCRLAQEIAENIHERNRLQRTGSNPAKLNMTLRASLQKLKQNIAQLRETLVRASSQRRIMQSEADRRQNLVDNLVTREKQLCASFSRDGTDSEPSRSSLMSGGLGAGPGGAGSVNPWLVNESEETRGLTFGEIKQQQQHIIEAQDAGLDALAAVISRQKRMGEEIGNELDEQNEIIDDITQLVDKTDSRIRNETRRVKLVETKSASCGMLVVIVLLLIAIIVVAAWPT
ncbi:syntaxin-8 [Colossoma macropomum]|uniref:syntaxin-8 n=1 Tax=Colossoma macropomum TaxID=42526 RepID=UPI0018654CFD|nr:syntaxin-8 [Colossoma macropomum]